MAGKVWHDDAVMMRPLLFDFPEDRRAKTIATEYMFGPSLLVCPVTEPMYYAPGGAPIDSEKRWTVYLPAGCDWVDYWDGKHYPGGREVTVDATLDRIPLFVKAGSIIPMAEGLQYANQPIEGPIEIHIYPGADANFDLYEDSGDGYGYEQGEYTLTHVHWDDARGSLSPLREDMKVIVEESVSAQ